MPNWKMKQAGPDGEILITADTEHEARCILAAHILQPYGDARGPYVGIITVERDENTRAQDT